MRERFRPTTLGRARAGGGRVDEKCFAAQYESQRAKGRDNVRTDQLRAPGTRRKLASVSLTAVTALILSACGGNDAPAAAPPAPPAPVAPPAATEAATKHPACDGNVAHELSINASVGGFIYLAHHIADQAGLYDEFNVDVTYEELGGGSIPALLSGDTDVAMTATNRAFTLRNQGRDVKAFGMGIQPNTSTFVVAREIYEAAGLSPSSTIQEKMNAVRGSVLGTTSPGAGADVILRAMLREGGLDPETDVEILYLEAGSAVLAAFERRDIQGFTFSPPTSTRAIMLSNGEILLSLARGDYPAWDELSLVAHIAQTSWLENNRDAAGCWLAAMQAAHDIINQDGARARELGKAYITIDDEDLYNLAYDQMFSAWNKEVCFTVEDRKLDFEFESAAGGVNEPNEAHWDISICEEYVLPYR